MNIQAALEALYEGRTVIEYPWPMPRVILNPILAPIADAIGRDDPFPAAITEEEVRAVRCPIRLPGLDVRIMDLAAGKTWVVWSVQEAVEG